MGWRPGPPPRGGGQARRASGDGLPHAARTDAARVELLRDGAVEPDVLAEGLHLEVGRALVVVVEAGERARRLAVDGLRRDVAGAGRSGDLAGEGRAGAQSEDGDDTGGEGEHPLDEHGLDSFESVGERPGRMAVDDEGPGRRGAGERVAALRALVGAGA